MNFRRDEQLKITSESQKIITLLLAENKSLKLILEKAGSEKEVREEIRQWVLQELKKDPDACLFYAEGCESRDIFESLSWKSMAAIRILDYIDRANLEYIDLNLRGKKAVSNPFKSLWMAIKHGEGDAKPDFFLDMLHLFRQFNGTSQHVLPDKEKLNKWMERHPTGLEPTVVELRKANKHRIISALIKKIETGEILTKRYAFSPEDTAKTKYDKMLKWWDTDWFHLRFAVRKPELLNEMLDYSLSDEAMEILNKAQKKGIPLFINPYYLSLLNVNAPAQTDMVIRDYVFFSKQLIDEFGHIVAWEKEDVVEPGKPNAAGWILPTAHNLHRRYPEVAILIPDTSGRACGGLCVSCQRMYDFQSGRLNFELKNLQPCEKWNVKLQRLMNYFKNDTQLRDILITGGDALMNSNQHLREILDAVYEMAKRKQELNIHKKEGKKFAEMQRIRLGTRMPVYLPQRIDDGLIELLQEFKEKANRIGFRQFMIQTHFETAMEITPESKKAVQRLLAAGWKITNQQVFTAAASRRGHTAKLRKVLNDIGVVTYYTFSVKGYMENSHNFATNARAVQEQLEEKVLGKLPVDYNGSLKNLLSDNKDIVDTINRIRKKEDLPFLATDRNVLNLPGVGKSLTFRTIGITPEGRRILEFDHDHNRIHSPVIDKMGKVVIVESKSMAQYIDQIQEMGENPDEYMAVWGYSIGVTEPRMNFFEYPKPASDITEKLTNFDTDYTREDL